jgi:hypothetical protein
MKIFKSIILLVFFMEATFTSVSNTRAAESFELTTSKDQVAVGEVFELGIVLDQVGGGKISISGFKVPGIDNFQIQGTSTSTQAQVINGNSAAKTTTTYTLKALQEGEFVLGPVQGSNGESNTVKIVVTGKGTNLGALGGIEVKDVEQKEDLKWGWGIGLFMALIIFLLAGVIGLGRWMRSYGKTSSFEIEQEQEVVKVVDKKVTDNRIDRGKDWSCDEMRGEVVELVGERLGKDNLHSLSTAEISALVEEENREDLTKAVDILRQIDEAIYAKKPADTGQLQNELLSLKGDCHES